MITPPPLTWVYVIDVSMLFVRKLTYLWTDVEEFCFQEVLKN